MRLDKALQSQGFGSRKVCRGLVETGQVLVDGVLASDPDAEVATEALTLTVAGLRWHFRERVLLMLHKPVGVECSHAPTHHPSVFTLLPEHLVSRGVQSVGRLDADSSGLLLFTDDGALVQRLTSPKSHVPKSYVVTCAEEVTNDQLARLEAGVQLKDSPEPSRALRVERTGANTLVIDLDEGKYHQVRRMVAAAGNHVQALHRQRIGSLVLPAELAPGHWSLVSDEARAELLRAR